MDEIIKGFVPRGKLRFEYWNAALSMERGVELAKMDISGKLKEFKYEPEHHVMPVRAKDEFITENRKDWRQKLMEELDIAPPEY